MICETYLINEKNVISMAHPMWLIKLIIKSSPNRFTIAKMSRIPGIGNIIDKLLFEDDDIIYLPHEGDIEVNKSFDLPTSMILPPKLSSTS